LGICTAVCEEGGEDAKGGQVEFKANAVKLKQTSFVSVAGRRRRVEDGGGKMEDVERTEGGQREDRGRTEGKENAASGGGGQNYLLGDHPSSPGLPTQKPREEGGELREEGEMREREGGGEMREEGGERGCTGRGQGKYSQWWRQPK
jgi:hypothetical protein